MLIRALVPALLIFLGILPHYAYSYCIYNKMEDGTKLFVEQVDGQHHSKKNTGAFRHWGMSSGSKECCPYNNYVNCNEKLSKDATVTFVLNYGDNRPYNPVNLRKVSCPAGGYIVAKGKSDDIRYESFDTNHKLVGTIRTK